MPIEYGIVLPQGFKRDLGSLAGPIDRYEAMTRVAVEAERLGYDSVWLYDHLHPEVHPGGPTPSGDEAVFECWTSAAALARDTGTIRIGPAREDGLHRRRPELRPTRLRPRCRVVCGGSPRLRLRLPGGAGTPPPPGGGHPDHPRALDHAPRDVRGALLPGSRCRQRAEGGTAAAPAPVDRRRGRADQRNRRRSHYSSVSVALLMRRG